MNNVNLDTIRVGATPLGVGDEVAVQQMPAEKKILSGAGVIVSTAFDSLVDRLARDAEKTLDAQMGNRLALSVSAIAARAGITKESQLKALKRCEELTNQIAADTDSINAEKDERARLEAEIAADPEGPAAEELKEQLAACNERIGKLDKAINTAKAELDVELAKLDDKSSRVFAAAVRVSSSEASSYLDVLRNLCDDEGDRRELPAIDAFNRLLAGEDLEKVILEELGIKG